MWKFVHAADLHIDSPMLGLAQYESAPVDAFRQATRRAFESVIDLCLTEEAKLLLLAGDVFDGEWRDYNTGLFFRNQLTRLSDAGTRTFLVRGNHDAASSVASRLSLPDSVTELGARAPEAVAVDDLGVAVHGMSFPKAKVTENLVPLYPEPVSGLLNLGVLHTNVGGKTGHDNYAPSSLPDLTGKGYDYWALGHVHAGEILSTDPTVAYPGCSQGRSVRECGPKGCLLVTVSDGRVETTAFVETDVARWAVVEAEAEDGDLLGPVREALSDAADGADGRPLAARLACTGASAASEDHERDRLIAELRAIPQDLGADVWIEKVELRARPLALGEASEAAAGLVADLLAACRRTAEDTDELADIAGCLDALRRKVGLDLSGPDYDIWREGALRDLLLQAGDLLAVGLEGGEDA